MALLMLLVIALLGGLGVVFEPLLFVAVGLLVVWAAGWLIRRSGRRWYAW
jgi:hypothetical protein